MPVIERHITQLSEDLHLPPQVPKDSNGNFQIKLSSDLIVSVKDLSPGFLLSSFLGLVPKQKKEDSLIYLMKANFLGQGTGEQIIGMDPDEKFLTLSRSISYEMNYQKFKETLEEFVNYLRYWKGEVQKMQAVQSTP